MVNGVGAASKLNGAIVGVEFVILSESAHTVEVAGVPVPLRMMKVTDVIWSPSNVSPDVDGLQ